MQHIYFANPKGGCGKSTLAIQLAAYYTSLGCTVALIDHDQQKSASDWIALRPSNVPMIHLESAESIAAGSETKKYYDYVIHDMPATWTPARNDIATNASIIIPILPSPIDLKACLRFVMRLKREGLLEGTVRAGLVANRMKSSSRYNRVLWEMIPVLGLPLLAQLRDTQQYYSLMEKGFSIFDRPTKKVEKDIANWQPLLRWLVETKATKGLESTLELS